jgi:hypothetical protein
MDQLDLDSANAQQIASRKFLLLQHEALATSQEA